MRSACNSAQSHAQLALALTYKGLVPQVCFSKIFVVVNSALLAVVHVHEGFQAYSERLRGQP